MQNQVVVVTGANAGVGRAAARAFAEAGAGCVVLLARDRARLDETAAEVQALGARALVVEVDVSDAAASLHRDLIGVVLAAGALSALALSLRPRRRLF